MSVALGTQAGSHRYAVFSGWFPVYLCLVVAGIVSPLCLGRVVQPWQGDHALRDVVGNIIAFLPFGWAFSRRPAWRAAVSALLLSGALELFQTHLSRTPSYSDVVSNVAGALLGARLLIVPQLLARVAPHVRALGLLALAASALIIGTLERHVRDMPASDFSNWRAFPLYVGAEETGEPRWDGTLRRVRIYDRVVNDGDLRRPIADLNFVGGAVAVMDGPTGTTTLDLATDAPAGFVLGSSGLMLGEGHWRLPTQLERHVRSRLMATSAMSLVVEIMPASEPADGDRRILAMSEGMNQRDFSVGQKAGQLYTRVRTPLFGANARGITLNAGAPDSVITLVATVDRHWFSIRTDRNDGSELCVPMLYRPWYAGQGFTLTLVFVVLSTALGFSALLGRRSVLARRSDATAGALAGLLGLWATGIFQFQMFSIWTVGVPVVICWLVVMFSGTLSALRATTEPAPHRVPHQRAR